jgi:hypothetical protein
MWKSIQIFDNRFQVNEEGQVFNIVTEHYLTPFISKKGYKVISFTCNNERKKMYLHRILAQCFIPNPDNLPIVMHKDNNKLNCNLNNLKWGTVLENNLQAIRDGLIKVPRPDNRKYYNLYRNDCPVFYNIYGLKSVAEKIGYNNINTVRNYIYRNNSITSGLFKDWKIKISENNKV